MKRLVRGILTFCVVVSLFLVCKLEGYCITYQEEQLIIQLMDQGYTYEQALDEIMERRGLCTFYGTGGIDGINQNGIMNLYNLPNSIPGSIGAPASLNPTLSKEYKEEVTSNPKNPQVEFVYKRHSHSWDEEEVIKEPTCFESGIVRQYCSCGKTQDIETDLLQHEEVIIEEIPATCISYGMVTSRCNNCEEVFTLEQVEEGFASHTYVCSDESIKATCTEDGIYVWVCSVCGDRFNIIIDKKGHKYDEFTVDIEPKCTEAGLKSLHCVRENCNEVKEGSEKEISPKGHTEYSTPEIVAATFWKSGKEIYTCEDCGEFLREEVIPPSGGIYRFVIPGAGIVLVICSLSIITIVNNRRREQKHKVK